MSCMWSTGSIEKNGNMSPLEVQFVGYVSCLWWDRVCDICKFRPARNGIKEVISALLLLHLLLHSRIMQTSVLTWQVREKERERQDQWQAVKRFQSCIQSSYYHKMNNIYKIRLFHS